MAHSFFPTPRSRGLADVKIGIDLAHDFEGEGALV